MEINGFELGLDSQVYLIAEMSANHNGSIENAKKTIKAAKDCGANAVKIQTYTPDTLTIKSSRPEFKLSGGIWHGRQLYDLYEDAHTPYQWHESLFNYAKECGITLFSTPFDDSAVDLLESLNSPAYKIASFEIIDIPLIERVAKLKKPLLISTGAASITEITEAVMVARKFGAEEILLFHCVSSYPAPISELQLNNIKMLKNKFGVLVGLSDHSIGADAGFLSVALGAVAVEKHFIIDKNIGGPDSEFSATPLELKLLREKIDCAKLMIGSNGFARSRSEEQSSNIRRSIYFVNSKKKGQKIDREDIKSIRPGLGLHPRYFYDLICAELARDVNYGEPTSSADFVGKCFDNKLKSADFQLQKIIPTVEQELILFDLLADRRYSISHKIMPSFEEHIDFVRNNPYRSWWLVYDATDNSSLLGSVYINEDNSVGLNLDLTKLNFSASFFTEKLKKYILPRPAVMSKVYGDFYYNVSPKNLDLMAWFKGSDFLESQRSFCKINTSL